MTSTAQTAIDDRVNPLSTVLRASVAEHLKGIHTMLPGLIEEFDAATQRAKVTLANAVERTDGTAVLMPALVEVPVMFYRWGDFVLTGPVTAGDECIVVFSERSLDRFKAFGDTGQVPTDTRFFDLSDGYCLPGTMSEAKQLSGFNTSGMELRKVDGSTTLTLGDASLEYDDGTVNFSISGGVLDYTNGVGTAQIDGGKIKFQNASGELIQQISDLLQQLSTETVTPIMLGVPAPLNGAAVYTAIKVIVDSMKI